MFELRIIVIIFLLVMCFYYIYTMYDFNNNIINKAANNINNNIQETFQEITEKLEDMEETIENVVEHINQRMETCQKKINKPSKIVFRLCCRRWRDSGGRRWRREPRFAGRGGSRDRDRFLVGPGAQFPERRPA